MATQPPGWGALVGGGVGGCVGGRVVGGGASVGKSVGTLPSLLMILMSAQLTNVSCSPFPMPQSLGTIASPAVCHAPPPLYHAMITYQPRGKLHLDRKHLIFIRIDLPCL